MISQKTIDQEYKKLKDYLKILLSSEIILEDIPKNKALNSLFEHTLNIFYFLSVQKNKEDEANKFLGEYNAKVDQKINFSKNLKFKDDYSLIDEINYINVFIQNTYNYDIYSLKKSLLNSVKKIIPKNSSKNIVNNLQNKPNESQEAFNRSFNGESNSQFKNYMKDMYDPEFQKKLVKDTLARQRLQQDILTGRFYIYKTQPREIIFLKYVLMIVLALIAISIVVFTILVFQNTSTTFPVNLWGEIVGRTQQQINSISPNTPDLPIVTWNVVILILFYGGFVVWMFYKFWSELRAPNLNQKYFLRGRFLIYTIFFGLVFFVFNSSIYLNIFYDTWRAAIYFSVQDPQFYLSYLYYSIFGIYISIFSLIGINILLFIVGQFLNPKIDQNAIQDQVNKYMNEF